MTEPPPDESAVRVAFLNRYLQDRAAGRELPLEHYQSAFPGYEALIRAELDNFEVEEDGDGTNLEPMFDRSDPVLERYVRQAVRLLEAGQAVEPTALCRDHPELAAKVAAALGLPLSAATPPPADGEVVADRYLLRERLGSGAMGVVFAADDLELHRTVAVKLLDAGWFRVPELLARFEREAQTLAALEHDNVVHVFDRGCSGDTPYLVMEHLEGAPLADVISRCDEVPKLFAEAGWIMAITGSDEPPADTFLRVALRWGAELASGLGAAHRAGIYHRDIKPSNIFIRRDYRPVLLDFGIAARDDDLQHLTATATTLGTPWYMAPEQAAGAIRRSPEIDVYGLCATLYHLLTSQLPFEGEATKVLVLLQTSDPRPVGKLRPELPFDVRAILEKGMDRTPERRYRSMAELEADLRAFLDHRPVTARPLTATARWWRRVRRRPARALAVVAASVAVVMAPILIWLLVFKADVDARVEKARLDATLPSLLALEGHPSQRLLVDLEERAASIAVLDRILELDADDLPARLWRAALHLDQGDRSRAASDLERLVAVTESPYVAAVAQRYLAAASDRAGTEAVDLTGLPEPVSPADCFVAGFHELRNRHVDGFAERAKAYLDRAMEQYLPARDLRMIALLALGDLEDEDQLRRRALFTEAHDEAVRLEGTYEDVTARTAAVRGAALVALRQYERAVEPLEASLEKRPKRHGPLNNLGIALLRQNRLDEALPPLMAAYELRPHFWNTSYNLATLHSLRGEFDLAREFARKIDVDASPKLEWMIPDLLGEIALSEALVHVLAQEQPAGRAAGSEAERFYVAAIDAAPPGFQRNKIETKLRAVRGFLLDRRPETAKHLFNLLQLEPTNPYQIGNTATLLPRSGGLDQTTVEYLRAFLRQLAAALSTGDPTYRARQRQLRQERR